MENTNETNAQPPAVNTSEGGEPQAAGLIDRGNLTAERLERGIADYKQLVDRHENIIAKQLLAGRGQVSEQPKTPKEQQDATAQEMAEKVLRKMGYRR